MGRGDLVGANLQTSYETARARLKAWSGRPLSALSKVKVANLFFFSSLWYRTEIIDPIKVTQGNIPGYEEVEKEVGNWLFRGRPEVGKERLRDTYTNGGAQLVDIEDKVRTQRVLWLTRLLSMPEDAFPRVLADALIGQCGGGYYGLSSLKAMAGGLQLGRLSGFYKKAIAAWAKLKPEYRHGNSPVDSYRLFYNKLITDDDNRVLKARVIVPNRTVATVRDLRNEHALMGPRTSRAVRRTVERFLLMVPRDVEGAEDPDFVLRLADGGVLELSRASFKEVYVRFRALTKVSNHYETKWETALNMSLEGQWNGIWETLHQSKASLQAKSGVWRQIGLNFWTCHMDQAYIGRGDGVCEMCNEGARERWHTILECQVTKSLWDKLSPTLLKLDPTPVSPREMGLGLVGLSDRVRLRNRLAFTLRSAVLAMRWIAVRDVERATFNIWTAFLTQLKRELVEEYWTAKMYGGIANFVRDSFAGEVLGKMGENGVLEWGPLLEHVRVGYWDLYR